MLLKTACGPVIAEVEEEFVVCFYLMHFYLRILYIIKPAVCFFPFKLIGFLTANTVL